MKMLSRILLASLVVIIFLACSVHVYGETKTSIASGAWNAPSIWSPTGVPAGNDDVIIGTGTTVTLDANTEVISSLTIQSGAILQGDGSGWILLIGNAGGTDFVNNGTLNATGSNSMIVRLNAASVWLGSGAFNCSFIDLNSNTLSFASGGSMAINLGGSPNPFLNPGSVIGGTSVTFNYNGVSGQIISGSAITDLNSLTISNPSGVSLGANVTVNGVLALNTGVVTTNSNVLIISSTGSVTRSNGHVNGNLQKYVDAGPVTIDYEIGDLTAYSPVSLHFDSVTTPGNLAATVNSADHPELAASGIDGAESVNRYWSFTNLGIAFSFYDATFSFVGSDIDASADPDSFIVERYTGSSWNRSQIGSRTSTSTQILSAAAFSDFAIGEIKSYSITASATAHGTISPSGIVSVDHGSDQSFIITPDIQCFIDSLIVDGLHVDSTTSYTFYDVAANHTISAYFSVTQYALTITAANGSVLKNPDQPTYDYGSSVQLTAVPAQGYHFVGWSGDTAGSTNPLTVTMDGNKNITANFAINTYTLTVNAVNGNVAKDPDQTLYNHGTSVQLMATAATGYHFVDWSGDASGSTNPLTVTMDGNKNITANFAINTYTLTVNAVNGNVAKDPDQTLYDHGTSVQLTATAATGYHFVDWSGDAGGSTNPLTVTMDGNKNITANFAINTYTLTLIAVNGSVGKDPDQTVYNHGTSVQLTATAATGYHFVDWSGDAGGSTNPVTITMDGDKSVTANFIINTYSITSSATAHGTISPAGVTTVTHGMDQSFTITPDIGCYLDSLLVDGMHVDSTTSYTFENVISDHSISAYFSIYTYTIGITATNGSVTKNPDQTVYDYGSSVQLTAVPATGYHFVNWGGDTSGTANPITLTMYSNKIITANFAINTYTLTVIGTNGSITRIPDQSTYDHGTTVQLTATPVAGYHFVSWSGDATGSTNPLTVTMDGNKNITANFAINTYTLTINAANGSVAKNPDQTTYDHGTTVQLTAAANLGYHFVGWSGSASGSANPVTITMDSNKSVTAVFAINTYTLTLSASNGNIAKNPDQPTYNHGTAVQLTAVPNVGYNFVNWTGSATGSANPLTITMDSNKSITANFAINTYILTTSATNGVISRNPNQASYTYGTTVLLTATPNTGYHFVGWSGDASGSANPLSLTIDGNKNITAIFAVNAYTLTINTVNGTVARIPNQTSYIHGTTVQLTATPNTGYRFSGWSGSASGTANPINIVMDGNKTVTANFVANSYSLTINATNGTVTREPNRINYDYGTAVQLTAIPNTGYHFVSWGGSASGTANPMTIIIDGNKIINAAFAINAYTLTLNSEHGTIAKSPNQTTYNHGTVVRLTATPFTGFRFVSWSGDISSTSNPVNVTMNSDRNITANYAINSYTVSLSVQGSGTVTIDPEQVIYEHGAIVQITATPADTGWSFSRWSGDLVSTSNPATFVVDNIKNITATFAPNSAYNVMYRTTAADSLALDKDNYGKLNKFVKRKPDKIEFRFAMTADSVLGLNFEFSKDLRALDIIKVADTGDTLYKNIFFGTVKKIFVKLEPHGSLLHGDTIIVHGFCVGDDPVKIKYYWTGYERQNVPYFIQNRPRLPMPNRVNLLYETFIQGGFYGTGGLTAGFPRYDSSKYYGWFQTQRYSDVLRTLIVAKTLQRHTARPRGFDITWNGKIMLNQMRVIPPSKHDNKLLAEIITLKLNIVGSAMGKLPRGFGELIYGDGTENPLNGMTVKDIARYADSLIMGQYRRELYRKAFATATEFENLAQTMNNINASFEGPLDTVSFQDSLIFNGLKQLRNVAYLHANPFEPVTVITPLTISVTEIPESYALFQNYPNPFNPTTTIEFELQDNAIVTLKVYNILGQEVATLFDHEPMEAGIQDAEFNGANLASGVYLYRLIAEKVQADNATGTNVNLVRKMILLK